MAKCQFKIDELYYLGHVVIKEGIKVDIKENWYCFKVA